MLAVVLFQLWCVAEGHFNVFIEPAEFMKLLGINTDVVYVKEGVVNTYALNFVMQVPANISDLQFSWQRLTKYPLPYVLSIHYDNQGAMLPPQMNISSAGIIPAAVQTFRIQLICTGAKSAEVQILLQLNVTHLQNETSINFRRNKICKKGVVPPVGSIILDPEGLASSNRSLYVGVASAIAMIALVIITTSAVCIRTKKTRSEDDADYVGVVYDRSRHVFVHLGSAIGGRPSSDESGSYATIASIHKTPPSPSPYASTDNQKISYYASSQIIFLAQTPLQDPHLRDPSDRLRSLSLPKSSITLESIVQEGNFSRIYKGRLESNQDVIIKTVTESALKLQTSMFLTEGTMMFGLKHKHILPVIGANVDDERGPLLVYPYAGKGNLKRFLIQCRQRTKDQHPLSTRILVDFGIQIILGVMYLHNQCLCHKDLATRNCVIDDRLELKITDSGLAKDLFPDDYCCLYDNENRPIKWLSIETLTHKQFTAASDVWSFGIVLWELITLAQQPYIDIDFFQMIDHLQKGHRLHQPLNCPDELYAVMKCCWVQNVIERPSFGQLLSYLRDFRLSLDKYI
ncbi:tyrosine-protein kinase Dnt-like [Onthophagus taurus]|uniref:tyrosine-protein kinase Dnt-like n=1 Tax=Onthophagus taurus TaxID=166361 RepID=UPI0039BE3EC2